MRIRNRDAGASGLEQRDVRAVVADIGRVLDGHTEFRDQSVERRDLVLAGEDHMRDPEFLHASFDSRRSSSADYRDGDARLQQPADAVAVLGIECLGLGPVVGQIEASVGEHAVDVEGHQIDPAQRCHR